MNDFLYALWFFVPAGFANGIPVIAAKLPLLRDWNTPIDFGHTYRGKRLFGNSKTWRGLICAVIVGGLTFVLQQQLAPHLGGFSGYLANSGYEQLPWLTGCLLGAGALIGDAIESFFKRQRGIASGHSWFPFDQLDYIVGACLFVAPVAVLSPGLYIWILFSWLCVHLLFTYIGYLLHLKERPI